MSISRIYTSINAQSYFALIVHPTVHGNYRMTFLVPYLVSTRESHISADMAQGFILGTLYDVKKMSYFIDHIFFSVYLMSKINSNFTNLQSGPINRRNYFLPTSDSSRGGKYLNATKVCGWTVVQTHDP